MPSCQCYYSILDGEEGGTDVIARDMRRKTLVLFSMKIVLPKELELACAVDIMPTTVEQTL